MARGRAERLGPHQAGEPLLNGGRAITGQMIYLRGELSSGRRAILAVEAAVFLALAGWAGWAMAHVG